MENYVPYTYAKTHRLVRLNTERDFYFPYEEIPGLEPEMLNKFWKRRLLDPGPEFSKIIVNVQTFHKLN